MKQELESDRFESCLSNGSFPKRYPARKLSAWVLLLLCAAAMQPSLTAETLQIDRQITGVVHHYTAPDTMFPGSPGYVTDEILFDTTGLTDVDLDQYQTFKLRLFSPAGQKVVANHAGNYRSGVSIYYQAGGDSSSHSDPALLEFENFVGTMPTRDYSLFDIGDSGNVLQFQADEVYPAGGTGFTAMCYSFTPTYNPANSPKDFTQESSYGYPLYFSYQTSATTDPGPFVSLVEIGLPPQIPQLINYQGRVTVGTPAVNFEGEGKFKFAMVNTDATATFWSNDGTSAGGLEPADSVSLQVIKGLYSVLLGDTGLTHMTAIPVTVFSNPDVRLRVWFNDGTHGFQQLAPDQRIAAVGYAMMAGNVPDGTITGAKIAAATVDAANIAAGAVGPTQIAEGAIGAAHLGTEAVQSGNIAAGAVGTAQMADFAITSSKLRPGYEAGTLANGTLDVAPGVFGFTGRFACPFSVAPSVSLLTSGWTLGPVSPSGFSATLSYPPQTIKQFVTSFPPSPGRFTSLAVVAGALPAVSYYDGSTRTLKYAHAADPRGTMWDVPGPITVDNTVNAGQYSSLAVVAGNPAIAYYATSTGDLKYVSSYDAVGTFVTSWNPPVTIDSMDNVGQFVALAEVAGYPAICYYDATNTSLKFIRAKDPMGMEWELPLTLDNTDSVGQYSSLAVINGNPAISYFDATHGDLKYIRASDATGSAWDPPLTVDTGDTANVGTYTSLTVVDGNPAISYYDSTKGDLKFVRATDPDGTAWGAPLTPDSTGAVGTYSSLQVVNGRPAISYFDGTLSALKYVRASDAAGTVWGTPMILDNTKATGQHASLAVVDGVPAVSYFEMIPATYKFAVVPDIVPELVWHASDGSVAPITAATAAAVASGAIGSTQLAANAVQSANIANGAIGSTQLDPAIGLWTRNGDDISYQAGKVGIGINDPQNALHINGSMQLDKNGPDLGRLVLNTISRNDPGRYGIQFTNNSLAPFLGDDTQPTVFSFMTGWANQRANDATIRVHGKAANSWGTCLELTHDGTNGHINTDVGHLLLSAAGNVGIGTSTPASKLDVSGTVNATTFTGDGSGLTNIPASAVASPPPGMVLIPAGSFTMGKTLAADDDFHDADPVTVTLSAYYIAVTEVTLSQWQVVYYWGINNGYTFSSGSGKSVNHPVRALSWYDVAKWCNARSEMEGLTPCYHTDLARTAVYRDGNVDIENAWVKWDANGYRLPTEAEWEKAARGGLAGQRFPWGNTITQNLANYRGNTSYSYDLGPNGHHPLGNDGIDPYTTPVSIFAANGHGLHDVAGNVSEWCWDWSDTYAGGSDPHGPSSGTFRVFRGGGWDADAGQCRTAYRSGYYPDDGTLDVGFRPARSSVP